MRRTLNTCAFAGGGHSGHGTQAKPAATQMHKCKGTVEAVDACSGTVKINHGPIPSLKWPAMSMEFKVKDKAMLAGIKKGQAVEIDITQGAPGEFVIERIAPTVSAAHKGH